MANKVPMELTSYMSPDSLRKTTQLLKNLYDLHTKKYCGYEDINGSQYNGTVENFGSELLLEARKILLDKPSLANIFVENTFDFYFDIQYSDLIDTYDQQNMLCAVLKKDVLLSNNEYRIRFDNVDFINIPRAQSWSDPSVYKDPYIKTTTPPTLIITDSNGNVDEVPLILSDTSDINTTYYFRLYTDMKNFYDETYDDIVVNKTLTTKPIDDSLNGIPFVWMCIDSFNLLPDINFENNTFYDSQFLTIGTNGHDSSLIYPGMNIIGANYDGWFIKIIPDELSNGFDENPKNTSNYNAQINEIHLIKYEEGFDPLAEPIIDNIITYDSSYANMTLVDNGLWSFRKPKIGDFDYDGRTYKNLCYAYSPLLSYIDNFNTSNVTSTNQMIACLKIRFNESYYHKYEALNSDTVSGIHVDVGADHSKNGISKKNGIIHDLGDFDGLPTYFKYMTENDIHRAHTEVFVIRKALDLKNQSAMDKQTAGIIIDSGIPQNELRKVTADMPVSIVFDRLDQVNRKYVTQGEILSKNNVISEITYVDNNTFGNARIAKYQFTDKFVYRGNRVFSLGLSGFDPELEMGRVYIISNDKAVYENNEITKHKKAPRTFARICDIPTEFSQLVNIKNVAPTLVIDKDYVRTECNFSEDDKKILYNLTNMDHFITYNDNALIYPATYDLNASHVIDVEDIFPRYIRLNESININDTENVSFMIGSGGSGYEIGDKFLFYIGGICIKGIVKSVDEGAVKNIAYITHDDEESPYPILSDGNINKSNFDSSYSVYQTEKVSTNGTGLTIIVVIDDAVWDNSEMITSGILDDIYTFKFDYSGNIWAWEYIDGMWKQDSQITGIKVYDNIYDKFGSDATNSIKDTFLHNTLNPISNDLIESSTYSTISIVQTIEKDRDIFTEEDYSHDIEMAYRNQQSGLFFLDTGYDTSSYHNVFIYEKDKITNKQHWLELPYGHDLNITEYNNKSNKLRFTDNNGEQPSLYIYNPNIETVDTIETVSRDLVIKTESRSKLLSDVFNDSLDTPENLINQNGYLSRNVYIFDEYSTSEIDKIKNNFKSKSRDELIQYINDTFTTKTPLKFEGTEYAYTDEMLINYIVINTIYKHRESNAYRGETPSETIYRRPSIELFRKIGEQVQHKGNPVGKQPTGDFQSITTEIFDPVVKINNINHSATPSFIFRIDDPSITSLNGFRMLDDMDNDISDVSLIILNGEMYIADIKQNEIDWIKINRLEDNE